MATYVFHVWLQSYSPLGFEPDEEVWHDLEIGGSHTLATFHEVIFQALDRWESYAYEFITYDDNGIALRSYVHPMLYDGGPSQHTTDDGEINRFIEQAVPDDTSEEARERLRELQLSPPVEGNTAETTIDELDPENLGVLFYTLSMGDSWEHYIEL